MLMQVKNFVGPRNVGVVRRKVAEVLRMSRREVEHKLLGIVSLSVFSVPSVLLEKLRHCIFAFSNIAFSKRTSQS